MNPQSTRTKILSNPLLVFTGGGLAVYVLLLGMEFGLTSNFVTSCPPTVPSHLLQYNGDGHVFKALYGKDWKNRKITDSNSGTIRNPPGHEYRADWTPGLLKIKKPS